MRLSCPVHFANLHKIKLLVGVVEGFDLSAFDDARGIVSLPPHCVEWWYAEVRSLGVLGNGVVCPLQQQEAGRTVVVDGDMNAEPHPLWEYPCIALSNVFTVTKFDFSLLVPHEDIVSSGTVGISEKRYVCV